MTSRARSVLLWLAGLLAALLVAGIVSFYASSAPDGLERVAEDHGLAEQAGEHVTDGSPLADYQTSGVQDARLSGGIAGVVGVAVVLVIGTGVMWALRRRDEGEPSLSDADSQPQADAASQPAASPHGS